MKKQAKDLGFLSFKQESEETNCPLDSFFQKSISHENRCCRQIFSPPVKENTGDEKSNMQIFNNIM